MKLSIDAMMRLSGNRVADHAEAAAFCDEARHRSRAATGRLKEIADLAAWSDNVRSECDSLLGLVVALDDSVSEFADFFARQPAMATPFLAVRGELAQSRAEAGKAAATVRRWLDAGL